MKGKTKLRVMQILCAISLLITVFSIQRTYAKYFEKVDTTYATNIKRWVIEVNEEIIHGKNNELDKIMTPVFRENKHMNNNNTLVPGREGYFEFLIDYSKVDVAFGFELAIEQLNTKDDVADPLEDFEIYGYSIVETDEISGKEDEKITEIKNITELTQIIDPSVENEKTKKIRVLFRWNDKNVDTPNEDNEAGMNNLEDTLYAKEHEDLNYIVKIIFTQQV